MILKEFADFLKKYDVMSFAISFIIGLAVKDLVSALVNDIVMPIAFFFSPNGDWREYTVSFYGVNLAIGHFIGKVVDFLAIAIVVFVMFKVYKRMSKIKISEEELKKLKKLVKKK